MNFKQLCKWFSCSLKWSTTVKCESYSCHPVMSSFASLSRTHWWWKSAGFKDCMPKLNLSICHPDLTFTIISTKYELQLLILSMLRICSINHSSILALSEKMLKQEASSVLKVSALFNAFSLHCRSVCNHRKFLMFSMWNWDQWGRFSMKCLACLS